MRGFSKPMVSVSIAALALTLAAGTAVAQQSRDQIINDLKGPIKSEARGIKPAGTPAAQPPAKAVSAPSQAPAPQRPAAASANNSVTRTPVAVPAPASGPSVNLTVNFPTGSADLTPAARASLDALGGALSSNELANFRFRIEGHTDSVGSREENLALSQRRAEAVVAYLTNQYHIQPSRLEAVGMGQEHPLVETPPQTPQARNRRVQVINLGA